MSIELNKKRGNRYKHGECYKTEYISWTRIKERCNCLTYKNYKDYGGRGIKMCKRWETSYEAFLQDMGRKPSEKHTIERIDNNGDYEPSNCRWATRAEQTRNTRWNVFLEYNSVRKTLSEWSRDIGVTYMSIVYHLKTKTFTDVINYYSKRNVNSRCRRGRPTILVDDK